MNATATSQDRAGDAVAEISAALQEKFELPELHAQMFSLSALCAVVGTVRGVVDPAGGIMPASLRLVAHGRALVPLQSAVNAAFRPIHELQGARHRQAMITGEDGAKAQIQALQSKIERLRDLITKAEEELNQVSQYTGPAFTDEASMVKWNEVVNPELLKNRMAAREKLAEMEMELHRLTIVKNPVMVVNAILPGEIDDLRRNSQDGVLFNLDERGISINQLLAASRQIRRGILHATAAALDHLAVRPENPRLIPLGNSCASVVTGYQAAKFMRNKEVQASGLLDQIIFLRLDETPERAGPADMPGENSLMGRLSQELMVRRSEKKSMVIKLSAAARELYWAFSRQVERTSMNEAEEFLSRLSLLPRLALKISLLMHIGAGGLDMPEISAATFEKAADLSWRSYEHQKIALQIPDVEAISDRCFDLEILKLVAKIIRLENPTRREIARSYHDQNYQRLEPLLSKAQADGWIREAGGRYIPLSLVKAAA